MSGKVTLILGGARSGKSWWAEKLAEKSGRPVVFVATATAGDAEMALRIEAHRAARPVSWRTVEAPDDLSAAVLSSASAGDLVLVDCLTFWVTNVMLGRVPGSADLDSVPAAVWSATETELVDAAENLIAAARSLEIDLILVSNEVGLGIVPPYPLGRAFRDALGRVNQAVARRADSVVLMIAGLPIDARRLVAEEFRGIGDLF